MSDVDGSFNDLDGRSKIFVRRRDDESAEEFAGRALELMIRSGSAYIREHDPDPEITR